MTQLAQAKTDRVALLKEQGQAVVKLEAIIKSMPSVPIKNKVEYGRADERRAAAKGMKKYFTDLLAPGIAKVREALAELQDAKNVVTNDADKVIEHETNRMQEYKQLERRKIREAEIAADRERERLQAIADAEAQRARMLKSAPAREKALDKAAEAQVAAETVSVKVEKVEASNSTDRVYRKIRVIDLHKLIQYVASQKVSSGLDVILDVNMPELNSYLKLQVPQPPLGEFMPGVELYEDINIFSRRKA